MLKLILAAAALLGMTAPALANTAIGQLIISSFLAVGFQAAATWNAPAVGKFALEDDQ